MPARRARQSSRATSSPGTGGPARAEAGGGPAPRVPRQRRGGQPAPEPLGSLTQQGAAPDGSCRSCLGTALTRLSMELRDGTPVEFVSCHDCETRWWEHEAQVIDVQNVLDRTARA